jgi:V/A-type H+-transporting ATPase subunit B
MDGCLQLYSSCRETREKRDMGFEMSVWDDKLISYGDDFEDKIMDLSVNIPLFDALDLCWEILAANFTPVETGIRRDVLDKHWPVAVNS